MGQPELLGFAGPAGFLGGAGAAAVGSGIGSGLNTGIKTGNPLAGLASGVLGGAGSYAGSTLLGPALGNIGSSVNSMSGSTVPGFLGQQLGGFAGNAIPGATVGSLAGGAIGSSVGSSVGENLGQQLNPMSNGGSAPPGFSASQQPQMGLPQSLSQFGSLSPQQQATNIASKGVYGGGNGRDETNYFTNLINRQLFDSGGNVAQNTSGLAPVDLTYLNQLGISGSSPTDLLKGISQYGS